MSEDRCVNSLFERSDKGVGSEGGNSADDRSVVSRRLRAEGRFDCYLQYFRKVYLNKGDLISEWLLGASREPFWTHLGALVGCPVALLERLAALQGSLGTLLGDPWGALVSLWCHLLSRRVNLGVLGGLFWLLAVSCVSFGVSCAPFGTDQGTF